MKKPKMIMFDFGETLQTEKYSPIAGNRAVMERAAKNPDNVTYEEVDSFAKKLYREGRVCGSCGNPNILEMHLFQFNRYVYEYFGIEFDITPAEVESIYFNAAITSEATPGIEKLLRFLDSEGIRTAVISNIPYSGQILYDWIRKDLPWHRFEFILASSEYLFRKPSPRIFQLALRKAGLNAEDTWYCGNNSYFDVTGAHLSGIYPIWYKGANWTEGRGSIDFKHTEISEWDELIDILLTAKSSQNRSFS